MKRTSLFLLILFSAGLLAQGPRGGGPGGEVGPEGGDRDRPNPVETVSEYFAFDETQHAAFVTLLESRREQFGDLREQAAELRGEIRDAVNAEEPDAAAIGELVLAEKAVREQMRGLQEAALAEFEAMLSAEQLEQVDFLIAAREAIPTLGALRALRLPILPAPERGEE